MYFYDPAERQSNKLIAGISGRTFWGDKMLAALIDLEPNTTVPNHTHPHEQIGYVLEGEMHLTIAGEERLVTPGILYVIPGGVEHSAQTGETPAKLLEFFSPVREEYKFE